MQHIEILVAQAKQRADNREENILDLALKDRKQQKKWKKCSLTEHLRETRAKGGLKSKKKLHEKINILQQMQ